MVHDTHNTIIIHMPILKSNRHQMCLCRGRESERAVSCLLHCQFNLKIFPYRYFSGFFFFFGALISMTQMFMKQKIEDEGKMQREERMRK